MLLTEIPLFAYGTLRSDRPNAHLTQPYIQACRRAEVSGSLHYVDYVDENGVLARTVTYSPEGRSKIEGELQTLAAPHRLSALAQLDRKELNFGRAGPARRQATCVFVRQLILVTPHDEPPLLAWTYVLADRNEGLYEKVQPDADGIVRYKPQRRNVSRPGHNSRLAGCI